MNAYTVLVLALIWLIMFWCNRLYVPNADDYLYAYIITRDTIFHNFVPDAAVRISSVADIITSQFNHYFLWGGRVVAHVLVQFFIWQDELIFDILNAAIFVLFIVEINWIVERGKISFDFSPSRLIWLFFALWIFTLNFPAVCLWTTGACNYLWTAVIVLAFLRPYVRQWFVDEPIALNPLVMFVGGLVAGWTNENSVCWLIVALALLCHRLRAEGRFQPWNITGLLGMSIGYAFMILAPGNLQRALIDVGSFRSIIFDKFEFVSALLGSVFLLHLVLWYFFLRNMHHAKDFGDTLDIQRSLSAAKMFAFLSVMSILILTLSPEFNLRPFLPSLVDLLIAVTIIIRLQRETGRNTPTPSTKIFLRAVGGIVFAIVFSSTVISLSAQRLYFVEVERKVEQARATEARATVEVTEFRLPTWLKRANFYHSTAVTFKPKGDPNEWFNKAFAHYHGIADLVFIPDKKIF